MGRVGVDGQLLLRRSKEPRSPIGHAVGLVKAIGVLELGKHIVGRKSLCAAMYEIKANTRRLDMT
jgi:hypothetical protein